MAPDPKRSGDVIRRALKAGVAAGLRVLPWKNELLEIARTMGPPRALYRRLPVHCLFRVRVGGGAPFRLAGHGLLTETELFWRGLEGNDERESLRCWMQLCREASVIVDVGAYIGVYSLAAGAVNPHARVFGFEPSALTYSMFKANCALNSFGVRAIRAAVGDRDGMADLFVGDDLMIASLGGAEGCLKESVPIRTLKGFLREEGLGRVDLMKVDVETFEPSVIEGMGDLLERCRPAMIVEVLNDNVGTALERILPRGYLYFHIDEKRGLVRTNRITRLSRKSRNYLFCTEEAARRLIWSHA